MVQNADKAPVGYPATPPGVIIFGSGACARKIVCNLKDRGIDVCLAMSGEAPPGTPVDGGINLLTNVELDDCRGFTGNFRLRLIHRQGSVQLTAPAIVVAEDPCGSPNHSAYGLTPGPQAVDISTLEAALQGSGEGAPFRRGSTVALLCGWRNDAQPSVTMRMIEAGLALRERLGITVYFLSGNLKVAAPGAEEKVQSAKRSGVVFLKFTHDYPTIGAAADGRFGVDYVDELTRSPFRLEADGIVVDETIGPAPGLAALARKLGIDRDAGGFPQADNVRRTSNLTNRRGIFVAGGGRGVLAAEEQAADADQASLAVTAFLQGTDRESLPPATVQRGRCARCLTCRRLCPHLAVEIGARISIVDEACQRCGLCAAGCPAHAIDMDGVSIDAEISRFSASATVTDDASARIPRIMVLGCTHSAGQALALISLMGQALPPGVRFVEVPCGGSIASRHLLTAFENGAEGVMLCICHKDNCRSQTGNRILAKRAASVQDLLNAAGVESQRLRMAFVAANMGNEMAGLIDAFAGEIDALAGRRRPADDPPAR
ncbi:MAG TPA: hydrogenase iron-sulfur subunit [Desulfosarcina sp.]|nr:hydrogenase iron-sulfur subunit [Desulfosarcina sp.]